MMLMDQQEGRFRGVVQVWGGVSKSEIYWTCIGELPCRPVGREGGAEGGAYVSLS